jgi:hypothetical protein
LTIDGFDCKKFRRSEKLLNWSYVTRQWGILD